MNRDKIIKMVVILAAIVVIAGSLGRSFKRNSITLTDYAALQGTPAPNPDAGKGRNPAVKSRPEQAEASPEPGPSSIPGQTSAPSVTEAPEEPENTVPRPTGVLLNGNFMAEQRVSLSEDFYYEPLSDRLCRYITGISFPCPPEDNEPSPEITFDELRYVHILHYDFEGNVTEGELICNEYIAQDLVEIFQELYRNEYKLEKVLLIDEYGGDDIASMEDNNTSCFNYRPIAGSSQLSRHSSGLAVDINPLYNPYVAYDRDGAGSQVSPASALPYADRSGAFPYKIDENDLCCKLFLQHGFTWGGNWNDVKDYQHFQKTK